MTGRAWDDVVAILEDAVGGDRVSPAAALLVGRGSEIVFEHSAGVAGPPGDERACDATTIFDLASLTKPLVTVALVLDLVAHRRLSLETRVGDVLPDFALAEDPRRAGVTVRDLLRHDSGLPAYRRCFEDFPPDPPTTAEQMRDRRRRMFAMVEREPLERDPGAGSVYSDLGFLVLGSLLEAVGEARIDELARTRLFEPLGEDEACYVPTTEGPSVAMAARCATAGTCPWRGGPVHAVVQDENAYAMGGVAPHAGLFATTRSVHRLVSEWVAARQGRGLVLEASLVEQAWDPVAAAAPSRGRRPTTWAAGWDTPTPGASSAGSRIGAGAVGHLGYTGTSIWIDPSRGAHVVLLTNRIACGRDSGAIRALRPRLHDAVFVALDEG